MANFPNLAKRIVIYISIIFLLYEWSLSDDCELGGTGGGSCELAFAKLGLVLLFVIVLLFDLLLSLIYSIYKKNKTLGVLGGLIIIAIISSVIVIEFVFPTIEANKIDNNKKIEIKENFTIVTKALKDYSGENNGLYPVESRFCTIGKNCSIDKLLLPYLSDFSINKNLIIYYQSFDGSDYTLQNATGLNYSYSSNLDRFVYDNLLFRGRHTWSECSSIAGVIAGNPFGVCILNKGSLFPQGWIESQIETKFSPEGY